MHLTPREQEKLLIYMAAQLAKERRGELEYLLPHRGQRGQSFVYELIFDGAVVDSAPRLPGLIEIDAQGSTTPSEADVVSTMPSSRGVEQSSRGNEAEFAGPSRAHRAQFAPGSRVGKMPPEASTGAGSGDVRVNSTKNAYIGKKNGAHCVVPDGVVPEPIASL